MAPKANTASSTAVDASRVEQEKDRLKRQTKQVTSRLTPIKAYLVAYNLVSAGLWLNILFLTISAVLRKPAAPLIQQAGTLSKLFGISSIPHSASYAANALARVSNNYSHGSLGWWTKVTQSLAVLEIVHSAVGWVRSPIATTAAQVFSRVWTVWGVVEAAPEASKTHSNPLFTTMVFAWSLTEVIRYTFYATSVLGVTLPGLNWLRYTTFLPLYPLGASSEAFLSFSTLPPFSTLPFVPEWIKKLSPLSTLFSYLPASVGKSVMKHEWGRTLLWNLASAGIKGKAAVSREWTWLDGARLALFVTWWPALYVLYTHMLGQRRKILGKGRSLKAKTA